MICHHCKEEINPKADYFGIYRKSLQGSTLNFHIDCFMSVAGEDYLSVLDNEYLHCKKCRKPLNGIEKLVCSNCRINFPKCPGCGSHMVPRTNKTNNSTFLGCSNYPRCKKTQKF